MKIIPQCNQVTYIALPMYQVALLISGSSEFLKSKNAHTAQSWILWAVGQQVLETETAPLFLFCTCFCPILFVTNLNNDNKVSRLFFKHIHDAWAHVTDTNQLVFMEMSRLHFQLEGVKQNETEC